MNHQELIRFKRAILKRAVKNMMKQKDYVVFMDFERGEAPVFVGARFTLRRADVKALRAEFGPEAI